MRLDIVPGTMISQVTDLLYPISDIHMEMFRVIVDISKDCLYSSLFLTKSLIFAEMVAAANSNLGIVVCFKGVTGPFPTMNEQCTSSCSFISRRYVH